MTSQRNNFRALRRITGWKFFAVSFAGRLPLAMNVVGVLTLVAAVRGSIAEAGVASAVLGIAAGCAGPLLGTAADRWGQRGVLTLIALVNCSALVMLIVATYAAVPLGAVLAACLLVGVTSPQISPLTRVRWMAILRSRGRGGDARGRLATAMSYEGMADELSFVGGPVLVGVLATVGGPAAPVVASALLTILAVLLFAWHPTARAARIVRSTESVAERAAGRGTLVRASVLLPVAGMFFMGGIFGAVLVSLTTYMAAAGYSEQTGLVFGCLGASSALCAALTSRLPSRVSMNARWVVSTVAILCASVGLAFIGPVWAMCVVLLLAGAAIGPLLVTLNTIGAGAAPTGRFATTMILLSSGVVVGQALVSALTGSVAQLAGYPGAILIAVACAAAGCATALASNALYRRRPEVAAPGA